MKKELRLVKKTDVWELLVFDAVLLGVSGSFAWNSMVLLAVIIIPTGIVWAGRGSEYTISTKRAGIFGGILFSIYLLLSVFTSNYNGSMLVLKIRELAEETAVRACYGVDNLPKGRISVVKEDDRSAVRLAIKSTENTELYLKGYVGSTYRDGRWSVKREDEYEEKYEGMASYLENRGFEPLHQAEQFFSFRKSEELAPDVRVKVENQSAVRIYLYTPMGSKHLSVPARKTRNISETEMSAGIFNPSEYEFEVWSRLPEDLFSLTLSGNESSSYKECEQIYRSFVYDNYLEIPEEQKAKWDEKRLDYVGGETAEEVVQSVREYVCDTKENKTPYEFASEAALLFRYCGMPARYVEGYYVGTSDYDDKMQAKVTDSNRHAWVEVYLDGVGFVTCEVMPGRYPAAIPSDSTAGISHKPKEKAVKMEDRIATPENARGRRTYWGLVAGGASGSILLAGMLVLIKRYKRRQAKKRWTFSDRLCESIGDSLKQTGVCIDFRRPYESERAITDLHGTKAGRRYHYLIKQIDKERFSQEETASAEQRHLLKVSRGFSRDVLKRHLTSY